MKILKPSHREKKRYLLIEGKDANKKSIEQAILDFIGVLGFAEANPYFIKTGKKLILAINRKMLDKIRTSFLLSNRDLKIARVSGVINKLIK